MSGAAHPKTRPCLRGTAGSGGHKGVGTHRLWVHLGLHSREVLEEFGQRKDRIPWLLLSRVEAEAEVGFWLGGKVKPPALAVGWM